MDSLQHNLAVIASESFEPDDREAEAVDRLHDDRGVDEEAWERDEE